jgi:thiosulfate dehydrogenase (quinone) large subunit
MMNIQETWLEKLLFRSKYFAWVWLILRVYVGWIWLQAGLEKIKNPVWAGEKAGIAVNGFLTGALAKTSGAHPDVQSWYAVFIKDFALPNATIFSYLVSYGEVVAGAALIIGAFTGIAAIFGGLMNLSYLLAGTVSINPLMLVVQIFLMIAWRTAGFIGLDRFIVPKIFSAQKK